MNTSKTAVSLALSAALSSSGVALAGDNPFGMQTLGQGYQVAEADAKLPEGKCGGMKGEAAGEDMDKANAQAQAKTKDGKCGEGKCGEGKCGTNKTPPAEGSQE